MSEGAGLYLHVPFCSAVCPYCDFAVAVPREGERQRFVAAIRAEIALHAEDRRAFDTVYLGGGTPSALSPDQLAAVLDAVARGFRLDPATTFFLEANPEDVTAESVATWRSLGIDFLSLGVQSFDARELRFLGRRHDPEAARKSVTLALAGGFRTVSVDLIFGLPDQAASDWRRNLDVVARLGPDHVSGYQLTVKASTPFARREARGGLRELGEDAQAELFRLTHELLGAAGYEAYEVSNFARDRRHRSRHNRKYWRHVPYLGLGPAAHSFRDGRRSWNLRGFGDYEAAVNGGRLPIAGAETLGSEELALEELMLRIRTTEGLDLAGFERRHGIDLIAGNEALLSRWSEKGLVALDGDRLRPTVAGLAVADALASRLELANDPRSGPGSPA